MNRDILLNCFEYTGVLSATSVVGLYSFSSGLSGACFNQLYSSGDNYYNNLPYDEAYPLIYAGSGSQPSGLFSKNNPYYIKKYYSGNFGALISMNHSGCLNSEDYNYILLSSTSGLKGGNSGVALGITPSNRLFLAVNNYYSTISQEISTNDFAFISVEQNRFINFGLFNLKDYTFHRKIYDHESETLAIEKLYFGGALSYGFSSTGYFGKLNEIYLFSGNLPDPLLNYCIDCIYATGFGYSQYSTAYTGVRITGSYWSGEKEIQITGSEKIIGNYIKTDGSTGYFYYESGKTGEVQIYESLVPEFELISYSLNGSGIEFSFDTGKKFNQASFNTFFDLGLYSGDVVEVYTYPQFNENLNLEITNNEFPDSLTEAQLFGNGLAETNGVDYSVDYNKQISGFNEEDILLYDLLTGPSVTVPFITGYIITGSGSSQSLIDIISVSGVSSFGIYSYLSMVDEEGNPIPTKNEGESLKIDWDIYINGQKLTEQIDYKITGILGKKSYYENHIYLSGNNALNFNNLNDPSEFKLVPLQKNPIKNLYLISGNSFYLNNLTGFSEQIWKNGVRQKRGVDYFKKNNCSFYAGDYVDLNYSFELLNSTNSFINDFITFEENNFLNKDDLLNEFNLLSGLVSYYKLDEAPAYIIKDSHGNNNLQLYYEGPGSAPSWDAFADNGIINKGFLTRTTESPSTQPMAQITDNSNLFQFSNYGAGKDFSISFWFKYPELADYNTQTLFSWGLWIPTAEFDPFPTFNEQINGMKIQLEYDNSDLFLNFISVSADDFPYYFTIKHQLTPSFNKGEWYHLVITYKNYHLSPGTIPKITIYLNNNIIKEEEDYIYADIPYIPHHIDGAATTRVTRIGAQNYLYDEEFWPAANGENAYTYIDELAIWYKTLTTGEVNLLWNNGNSISYENF